MTTQTTHAKTFEDANRVTSGIMKTEPSIKPLGLFIVGILLFMFGIWFSQQIGAIMGKCPRWAVLEGCNVRAN